MVEEVKCGEDLPQDHGLLAFMDDLEFHEEYDEYEIWAGDAEESQCSSEVFDVDIFFD